MCAGSTSPDPGFVLPGLGKEVLAKGVWCRELGRANRGGRGASGQTSLEKGMGLASGT